MTTFISCKIHFLLVSFLLPCFLLAQNCLPQGILFSNQVEIDNFAVNYPGCTTVQGDVTINAGPGGDITNLNGLAQLTAVGGTLEILHNPILETLAGLDNLVTIGQAFQIVLNAQLENLNGLEMLQSIGNEFLLDRNNALVSMEGLSGLTSVGGDVRMQDNVTLPTLEGLENLTEVGGTLLINRNNALVSLAGLSNLESVGAVLSIVDNVVLSSLEGLESLLDVGGELIINSNDQLLNLDGLRNLQSIGGNLQIMLNDVLLDLDGIAKIDPTSINILFIRFNPELSACAALSVCEFLDIEGSIALISNNSNGCNSRGEVQEACDLFLPIVWGRPLEAIQEKENVLLEWGVVNQLANDYFRVEHSTDGKTFTSVEIIPGESFSQEERSYFFVHDFPSSGINYYRIKQVDEDGSFTYSNLVSVYYETARHISVYPNPVSAYLFLKGVDHGDGVSITISNTIGEIIECQNWSGGALNFTNYPVGVYFLRVEGRHFQHLQKVIRQ